MMKKTGSFLLLTVLILSLALGVGGATAAPKAQVTELVIFWAQWPPADYLQEIGNRYAEAETGIKVTVIQEPWGTFLNRMTAEWAAKGDAYDMVVGDGRWLGQGAEQGTTWN